MPDIKTHASLPRSVRAPYKNAQAFADVDAGKLIDVTVRVRRRVKAEELSAAVHKIMAAPARQRQHPSRAEFGTTYGADPKEIEAIKAFASRNGLAVTDASAARRSVHLRGTASAMNRAFGVALKHYRYEGGTYRGHADPVMVPTDLAPLVEAVVGFDTRPHARPHFQIAEKAAGALRQPRAASADFSPTDLATIYNFPADADGSGQVIGIIELMQPHGSGFRLPELHTYFGSLGVNTPEITVVAVDGGANAPGTDPTDPLCGDGEVVLDIEVAGAVAPQAKIVVYFAPNTAQGFLDVINRAVHDSDHNPSVISLSWGSAEDASDPTNDQINQILHDAVGLGVTFCVASGDSGSRDNPQDPEHASVDFPSASPFALACGGTHLETSGTTITAEVVWEGHSGGGVSRVFDLPDYQAGAGVPHATNPPGPVRRGVPDVSGDADPATGYRIHVDGQPLTFGGTSAVAPLWAALVARLNQKLGHPVGFLNPVLYQHGEIFHDIVVGDNVDYRAGAGWDPCTGLGSPNGAAILQLLQGP
ncbi:MAG TPA: S53 family peptidase [Pirellulales bacterium]|jgi:kumamolisin|nr:S53 family peptidase [Pirellulales bacterium]